MKTANLIGADLDEWVARAEGHILRVHPTTLAVYRDHGDSHPEFLGFLNTESAPPIYSPSTNPAQGQPIMEREKIGVAPNWRGHAWAAAPGLTGINHDGDGDLCAGDSISDPVGGPTMLIAGMRARVAQVYGDTVTDEGRLL